MLSFFYMNQDISVESLKDQAINNILAETEYDSRCINPSDFQRATQSLVNAYVGMNNAFAEEEDDYVYSETNEETSRIWKERSIKGFQRKLHAAGHKNVSFDHASECVDWPETVNWNDFTAPRGILRTAALAYGEHEAIRSLQMMDLHKKVVDAKADGTLDASNQEELKDFIDNNC